MFFDNGYTITKKMVKAMEIETKRANESIERKRLRLEVEGTNERRRSFSCYPCGD